MKVLFSFKLLKLFPHNIHLVMQKSFQILNTSRGFQNVDKNVILINRLKKLFLVVNVFCQLYYHILMAWYM